MRTALLAFVLLFGLVACDEEDPSTSKACKQAREQYALAKIMRDRIASHGLYPTAELDADLAKFQSDHWECFK
jgi:hypothetical protein